MEVIVYIYFATELRTSNLASDQVATTDRGWPMPYASKTSIKEGKYQMSLLPCMFTTWHINSVTMWCVTVVGAEVHDFDWPEIPQT